MKCNLAIEELRHNCEGMLSGPGAWWGDSITMAIVGDLTRISGVSRGRDGAIHSPPCLACLLHAIQLLPSFPPLSPLLF